MGNLNSIIGSFESPKQEAQQKEGLSAIIENASKAVIDAKAMQAQKEADKQFRLASAQYQPISTPVSDYRFAYAPEVPKVAAVSESDNEQGKSSKAKKGTAEGAGGESGGEENLGEDEDLSPPVMVEVNGKEILLMADEVAIREQLAKTHDILKLEETAGKLGVENPYDLLLSAKNDPSSLNVKQFAIINIIDWESTKSAVPNLESLMNDSGAETAQRLAALTISQMHAIPGTNPLQFLESHFKNGVITLF